MVERECVECGDSFHPYDEDCFVCDSCIEDSGQRQCTVCGKFFKSDEDDTADICGNCLLELEVQE